MKSGLSIESEETTNNNQTDLKTYQHLIEKLMYLAYGTRPDILFIVG